MTNIFEVKNFCQLLRMDFNIPYYQRGYRWEKQQVEDLLNDLAEFVSNEHELEEGEFYCLQPIVVKKNTSLSEQKGCTVYDIIDGQQRITTIYLLLKCLENTRKEQCDNHDIYSIEYEKANESECYLSTEKFETDLEFFNKGKKDECSYYTNIDAFFIFYAYKTMYEWFNNHKRLKANIVKSLINELNTKNNDIRVIWYELVDDEEEKSIDAFTRLNEGKIPLTESELIKALILQCDCYTHEEKPLMQEVAFRRACEWDNMEKSLQNSLFWAMLTPDAYNPPSHIDLVISFVCRKIKNSAPSIYAFSEDKKLFSFLVIDKFIKETTAKEDNDAKNRSLADAITEVWQMIQDTYIIFHNWFINRKIYHLLGLLTLLKKRSIQEQFMMLQGVYDIFTDCTSNKDKAISKLEGKIGQEILIKKNMNENSKFKNSNVDPDSEPNKEKQTYDIFTINYEECPDLIIKELETFNIYLHVSDNANNSIFQFDKFRKYKVTSIEHIHPQNLDTENMSIDDVRKWFADRKTKVDTTNNADLRNAVDKLEKIFSDIDSMTDDKQKAQKFFDKKDNIIDAEKVIDGCFDELAKMKPEYMHTLCNMALVDKETNSALSNNLLYVKRHILQEREQLGVTYVPIGTYAAFNKRFSEDILDLKFWSPSDRDRYFNKIKEAYDYYVDKIEK